MAPTQSPCYAGLNKMTEYTLLPAYVYAPSFRTFQNVLKVYKPPHPPIIPCARY
jgi:hypothetical protein